MRILWGEEGWGNDIVCRSHVVVFLVVILTHPLPTEDSSLPNTCIESCNQSGMHSMHISVLVFFKNYVLHTKMREREGTFGVGVPTAIRVALCLRERILNLS